MRHYETIINFSFFKEVNCEKSFCFPKLYRLSTTVQGLNNKIAHNVSKFRSTNIV